jgi:hypothetical protein
VKKFCDKNIKGERIVINANSGLVSIQANPRKPKEKDFPGEDGAREILMKNQRYRDNRAAAILVSIPFDEC